MGERVEVAAGWREVSEERLGSTSGPRYVRQRAIVAWTIDESFAGIFATAPQRVDDLEHSWRLFDAICASHENERLRLFCDARHFRTEESAAAVMQHMMAEAPRRVFGVASRVERAATILPVDWLRPWWRGAIEGGLWAPIRAVATDDLDVAWRSLDPPPSLPAAVARLTDALSTRDPVLVRAQACVETAPSLDLVGVARQLGMSARGLQRALAQTGETFAALRERVRLAHAIESVAESDHKIEYVASAVGFRSRSHFVSWFRQRTGLSPMAYRERRRRVGG